MSLITSAEAARRLAINRSTLTRWVQDGRLTPAMRVPYFRGPLLFHEADIDRLKAERDEQKSA